jgi:hypothetical protein
MGLDRETKKQIALGVEEFAGDFRRARTAMDVCALVATHYVDATYKYISIFLRHIGEGESVEEAVRLTKERLESVQDDPEPQPKRRSIRIRF